MDKNCSIEKFYCAADDNELLQVSEMIFFSISNARIGMSVASGGTATIKIVGDGYLSETDGGASIGKTRTVTGDNVNTYVTVTSGKVKILIKDDYKIISWDCSREMTGDMSPLQYRGITENARIRNGYGVIDREGCFANAKQVRVWEDAEDVTVNLRVFKNSTTLTRVDAYNVGKFVGDISNLSAASLLTWLYLYAPDSNGCTGQITDLNNCVALTTLSLTGHPITGNLEGLLEAWAGNRSSDCSITIKNTNVKFHNTSWNTLTVSFSGSNVTVKDGSTTVGTYNGSTWTYA